MEARKKQYKAEELAFGNVVATIIVAGAGDAPVKLPGYLYAIAMDAVCWATEVRS